MTDQDWKLLNDVHLNGAYAVAKAAWDGMRERKYGRIINVSSAAGLYGNFGQAHYSAVKMGIVGLSNTLSIEGTHQELIISLSCFLPSLPFHQSISLSFVATNVPFIH
jgi:multifunctional beta-oxidation protein